MDKNLNPLRLIIALALIVYLGWLLLKPSPSEALVVQETPTTPTSSPAKTALPTATPTPKAAPALLCPGTIEQVTIGNYEIRLKISGSAERILVYTDQGNVTASTLEAGSAGEYRVRTPGPAAAVQLDNCEPLNLR
ncbi:hypothetical protein [Meiothermus hypogaeus]|uniref:Uncharacterized protein n=2 Tax=Meiothermus hypogaeus TaxID=884155 RepID=A0A511R2W0_9DEIN|nr:hypothetical protein [Meiothermus hypogaeus]RIH74589.1 hypothetical protein Mhypo_03266 [Meiothermus hypogaeus]GEM83919.1 hypothetical protein MHY01S_20850 [Meiothermus hypogaeus NBRC 106114]